MSINYVLHPNPLTDEGEFRAAVQSLRTLGLEEIIQGICRLETTVGEADIRSVLVNLFNVVEHAVLGGMNVCTPLFYLRVAIQGNFEGEEDHYNPARHQVAARAIPGWRLRRAVQERAQVVKGEAILPSPNPLTYLDGASGTRNDQLTAGGTGKLTGHRLKYDPADPTQGLFFVAEDGAEARVEIVVENLPRKVIFTVPPLTAGSYTLVARTKLRGSDDLRSGTLRHPLTVS